MLDTVPNHDTVLAYAEYILAEAEQIEAAKISGTFMGTSAHAKVVNVQGKPQEASKSGKGECKFFLTDEGCRRGSQCKWRYSVPDGKR